MVYLPGVVQGLNQGGAAYEGGRMNARMMAYEMALRNLSMMKMASDLNLNRSRSNFYNTVSDRDQNTAQGTADLANYYRSTYPDLQGKPDEVAITVGKQKDIEGGKTQAPQRPTPGANVDAFRLRQLQQQQRLAIAKADLQGVMDRFPQTAGSSQMPVSELQKYLRQRYSDLDPQLLNGVVHDVVTQRATKGRGAMLQGLSNGLPPMTGAVPATDDSGSSATSPTRDTDEGHPDNPSAGPQAAEQPGQQPRAVQKKPVTSDQRDYLQAIGAWDDSKYEVVDPGEED